MAAKQTADIAGTGVCRGSGKMLQDTAPPPVRLRYRRFDEETFVTLLITDRALTSGISLDFKLTHIRYA